MKFLRRRNANKESIFFVGLSLTFFARYLINGCFGVDSC